MNDSSVVKIRTSSDFHKALSLLRRANDKQIQQFLRTFKLEPVVETYPNILVEYHTGNTTLFIYSNEERKYINKVQHMYAVHYTPTQKKVILKFRQIRIGTNIFNLKYFQGNERISNLTFLGDHIIFTVDKQLAIISKNKLNIDLGIPSITIGVGEQGEGGEGKNMYMNVLTYNEPILHMSTVGNYICLSFKDHITIVYIKDNEITMSKNIQVRGLYNRPQSLLFLRRFHLIIIAKSAGNVTIIEIDRALHVIHLNSPIMFSEGKYLICRNLIKKDENSFIVTRFSRSVKSYLFTFGEPQIFYPDSIVEGKFPFYRNHSNQLKPLADLTYKVIKVRRDALYTIYPDLYISETGRLYRNDIKIGTLGSNIKDIRISPRVTERILNKRAEFSDLIQVHSGLNVQLAKIVGKFI